VRVRITRELRGSIDGIQLTRFIPGEVYSVSPSFGSYLLAERAAEPVLDADDPIGTPEVPPDNPQPTDLRVRD
jgi:hypothetical protein